MATKIEKMADEIERLKMKIADYQTRLRDLERLKTEMENADIVAMVRGVDVAPDELRAFIKEFKKQQAGVPPTTARQEESENED